MSILIKWTFYHIFLDDNSFIINEFIIIPKAPLNLKRGCLPL